jgi:hypothetical protein
MTKAIVVSEAAPGGEIVGHEQGALRHDASDLRKAAREVGVAERAGRRDEVERGISER